METASSILKALKRGQWHTSLDLKDAYFHIPILPSFRQYRPRRLVAEYRVGGTVKITDPIHVGSVQTPWMDDKRDEVRSDTFSGDRVLGSNKPMTIHSGGVHSQAV